MKDAILSALSVIIDPDLGKDIVTLGFIKDLTIKDGEVAFTIELTTPACPVKDLFKQQAHYPYSSSKIYVRLFKTRICIVPMNNI